MSFFGKALRRAGGFVKTGLRNTKNAAKSRAKTFVKNQVKAYAKKVAKGTVGKLKAKIKNPFSKRPVGMPPQTRPNRQANPLNRYYKLRSMKPKLWGKKQGAGVKFTKNPDKIPQAPRMPSASPRNRVKHMVKQRRIARAFKRVKSRSGWNNFKAGRKRVKTYFKKHPTQRKVAKFMTAAYVSSRLDQARKKRKAERQQRSFALDKNRLYLHGKIKKASKKVFGRKVKKAVWGEDYNRTGDLRRKMGGKWANFKNNPHRPRSESDVEMVGSRAHAKYRKYLQNRSIKPNPKQDIGKKLRSVVGKKAPRTVRAAKISSHERMRRILKGVRVPKQKSIAANIHRAVKVTREADRVAERNAGRSWELARRIQKGGIVKKILDSGTEAPRRALPKRLAVLGLAASAAGGAYAYNTYAQRNKK